MFEPDQYELLDFGEGRRLERFGPLILNRPCPAVEGTRKNDPALWNEIDAVFVPDSRDNYARDDDVRDNDARDRRTGTGHARGCWKSVLTDPPSRWMIGANMPTVPPFPLVFELKLTPFGHVGLFPEHALDWIKIGALLAAHPGARVLNLFAYTGGGTLAAAAAGAEVTHLDAAKNVVEWAGQNAELSGLGNAPIRWIAEDAVKYVRRALRRGCRYDAIILDPPTYGHGSKGEVWRLQKHLPGLLNDCFALLDENPLFLILTCHTPGFDAPRLANMLRAAAQSSRGRIRGFRLSLEAATGKRLSLGAGAGFTGTGCIAETVSEQV